MCLPMIFHDAQLMLSAARFVQTEGSIDSKDLMVIVNRF